MRPAFLQHRLQFPAHTNNDKDKRPCTMELIWLVADAVPVSSPTRLGLLASCACGQRGRVLRVSQSIVSDVVTGINLELPVWYEGRCE